MRRALLALIAGLLLAPAKAHATRVVSMNVCADQLLLELAAPTHIVALSKLARDPDASYHHRRARDFRQTQATAEQVLALEPNLVIASSYGQDHTIKLLRQQRIRVETLPIAQSVEEVLANIERMGDWLNRREQSARLLTELRRRLADLPPPTALRPLAAVFDANGYTVGASSLRGDMLQRAGFDNLATQLRITHYGKVSLESLLRKRPRVIVDSPYAGHTWSRAQALPQHPALRHSPIKPEVITLAVSSTICAGPWTIDTIEHLSNQRQRLSESSP